MKKYLIIILCCFLVLEYVTDIFSINKIAKINDQTIFSLDETINENIQNILSQKFVYLSKGRQSYVFESEDGNFVVKFFNKRRFSLPFIVDKIFLPRPLDRIREKKRKKKLKKFKKYYFHSYKLAYDEWKNFSALLYLHFSKTSNFTKKLLIQDQCSRKYHIDLNDTYFVVQKKAKPLIVFFEKMIYENNMEKALDKLLLVVKDRIDNLISDEDMDIEKNFGALEDEIIVFDVGRIFYDKSLKEKENRQKAFRKAIKNFRKWLKTYHNDYSDYFDERLEKMIRDA